MRHIMIVVSVMILLLALMTSCGGKTTPTTTTGPAVTTKTPGSPTPAVTDTPATTTPAATAVNNGYVFASVMSSFFYDLNTIQNYYNDGLSAMSGFEIGSGAMAASGVENTVLLVSYVATDYDNAKKKIPPEYADKLPPDGAIPAPPGACPAAADPTSKFKTKGGDTVTPDLLADKDIKTLPTEMINIAQNAPSSLRSLMDQLVPKNDVRLDDADGWNTLLWDKLKALQEPAESLMDYQMWNTTTELEEQVVADFRQSLIDQGVPQRVIDAFNASDTSGWYAGSMPTEADALAQMDITAVLTGSISGTVHEWRDFSFPGLGQDPEFGTQYGDGIVTFDQPDIGKVECSVDINLDTFDELGRAIGGTVTAIPVEQEGYKIVFTYKPDGSKDGIVLKDGEEVGQLTMTVDHDKFTNYIDIKEGTTIKLPEDSKTLFQ